MALRVSIIGYPRTGTTIVYQLIANAVKKLNWICIYEPFVYGARKRKLEGKPLHDYLNVFDNSEKLGDLYWKIFENSKWCIERLVKSDVPILGNYLEILKELDSRVENVLIKDIYAWLRLGEIVSSFPNCRFILTYASKEHIINEFLKIWEKMKAKTSIFNKIMYLLKKIRQKGLKSLTKIKTGLEYLSTKVEDYEIAGLPISLFYKVLTEDKINYWDWKVREHWLNAVELTYNWYLSELSAISKAELGNVMLVNLRNLQENPEKVCKKVSDFIGIDITSQIYLIKKV